MPETLTPLPEGAEEFRAPVTGRSPEQPISHQLPETLRRPEPLNEKDYELLQSFSEKPLEEFTQTELRLYEVLLKLQDHAFRDELTGLGNRKAWNREVEQEKRHESTGTGETFVYVIDVNDFKNFNTLYGHAGGDAALQRVAEHIGSIVGGAVRGGDVALRYAGDEFCVIARNVAPGGEQIIAERIYDAVANSPLDIEGKEVPITLSVGVAKKLEEDETLQDTFDRADEALLNIAKAKKGQEDMKAIGFYGEELPEHLKPQPVTPEYDVTENLGG